jgi:cytochrome c-type biogenesis protein CcmH/NrfG
MCFCSCYCRGELLFGNYSWVGAWTTPFTPLEADKQQGFSADTVTSTHGRQRMLLQHDTNFQHACEVALLRDHDYENGLV